MRSSSEVRWCRAKNRVNDRPVVTRWHAIVPGLGSMTVPPGVVCEVLLTGSLQFASDAEVRTLDGERHDVCQKVADNWIAEINPSPGPRDPDEPWTTFAPPGSSDG